ncbi:hypothetical protein CHARACLAT_032188 [Characodon lateralis]|uniref:Uncharacterized protein n=1 Tax=Characodon lateralis TaxID=208331 RepID=A0ABU7EEP2_9TELE|nr:hypothetical protein [Characodon lateralis]
MFTVSRQIKMYALDKPSRGHRMHKYLFLSSLNSNSLHVSKSQPCSISVHAKTRTVTRTVCTHAPGSREFVAELITRNGSIRRSVMINPVETPLLRSVTCRAAPPPAAPPSLFLRSLSGAPGGLRACTRSPGSSLS